MNEQKVKEGEKKPFVPVTQLHMHYEHDSRSLEARAIELLESRGYTVIAPEEGQKLRVA